MLTRNGPRPPADTYRSWRLATLAGLFVVLWALSGWHLLYVLHDEVFRHRTLFIASCAAPPLHVLLMLTSLDVGGTLQGLGLLALVAVPCWLVARNPDSSAWYRLAVTGILSFWVLLDFSLAYYA